VVGNFVVPLAAVMLGSTAAVRRGWSERDVRGNAAARAKPTFGVFLINHELV